MAGRAVGTEDLKREERAGAAAARRRTLLDISTSLGALVLLVIVGAIIAPPFTSPVNILNVLRQSCVNALLATGQTFVILSGGIDLSVGSYLPLVGVLSVLLMSTANPASAATARGFGWDPWLASLAGIALATVVGLVTGSFVIGWRGPRLTRFVGRLPLPAPVRNVILALTQKGPIPSFVVTLSMMLLVRGMAVGISQGQPRLAPLSFNWLGQGAIFGIPVQIYITLAVYVICYWVLRWTRFGRSIYAIGDNEEVARLSGININWVKLRVYALSGFMAGLAAVVLASRIGSGQITVGKGDELSAIAAVVVGGTSLYGGRGGIWGTLIGALIIAIVLNLINLLGVPAWGQYVTRGLVIVFAVYIDSTVRARARK